MALPFNIKQRSKMKNNTYIEDCFERPFLKKVSLKLSPKTFDLELGRGDFIPSPKLYIRSLGKGAWGRTLLQKGFPQKT
jgi:hypothetical protein